MITNVVSNPPAVPPLIIETEKAWSPSKTSSFKIGKETLDIIGPVSGIEIVDINTDTKSSSSTENEQYRNNHYTGN